MIGIVDYGMGNLQSVRKAFERIGQPARIVRTADELSSADKLVLPGVGAFGRAMDELTERCLRRPLLDAVYSGTPLLGICLGLQLLFERSEEHGSYEGLGLLRGDVRRLPDSVKVPHIGWNELEIARPGWLLDGIPDREFFYFVQSYYVCPANPDCVSGTTEYGWSFAAAVEQDLIFGVQFHPEKSQGAGLQILESFAKLSC
jgi:glutamine amidotransferase